MLNPLFFLISRFNIACSPLIFNLQINYPIRIKDIPFKSFQLWRLNSRGQQAIFNLEIKKKSGLSINPDIQHSKALILEN